MKNQLKLKTKGEWVSRYLKGVSILWLFLLGGCSQLQSNIPDPTVESPLIMKPMGSIGLSLGTRPGHSYIFTSDASRRPPNLTSPEIESSSFLYAGGSYSFTDRFQLGVEIFPLNAGMEPNFKWQVLGDGVSGAQLSFNGALGFFYSSKTGDQNGTFGSGGHNWKGSAQGGTARFGFSLGYFLRENFLPYFGAAAGTLKTDATIDHDLSSDGGSPAASYKESDTGRVLSVGGGVQVGTSTPVNVGATYSDIKYDRAGRHFKTQWSVSFSF